MPMKSLVFTLLALVVAAQKAPAVPTLRFPLSTALEVFDPTEAEDFITIRILFNLGKGLTAGDKNLKPQPALAESYKVSADKKTYTFKLKKAKWSDGEPLLASQFMKGFEHTLSPSTKSKLSQNFQELVVGAKDYKLGKIKDFAQVGIKALDEKTLQFKLERPAGYFLSLLTLPFAFPQREFGSIKAGKPTIGPYKIADLKSGAKILLVPNEHYSPQALSNVELKIVTESAAILSLYEKGELDVLEKVPSSDFDRFKNSPELVSAPFLATYYIAFNILKKPFDDVAVRKAIFASVQRQDLAKILKDPQIIASSLVPTPLPSSDKNFIVKASAKDLETAKKELSQGLELALDGQDKNLIIAALLQQQLKKALSVDVKIKTMEWKSYLSYLTHDGPPFFRFAWLAAFPDPLSHLNVFTSGNPNNYTGYANAEYDKLVRKVSEMNPSPVRTNSIIEAQRILLERDAVVMPLYHYKNYYLISARWQGIEATPMGILYFDKASPKREP